MNALEISEQELQRKHYAAAATNYDERQRGVKDEHDVAMGLMVGLLPYLEATSVLDIGSGTGRTLQHLKTHATHVRRRGVEPSPDLRAIAYGKGFSEDEIVDGDGAALQYGDGEFDVVTAFAVMHHARYANKIVNEMLRVASKAILISDCNNYGAGSAIMRTAKQALHATRLWPIAKWLKTGGKGYHTHPEEGVYYSYSVYDSFGLARSRCRSVLVLNTVDAGPNAYRTASH